MKIIESTLETRKGVYADEVMISREGSTRMLCRFDFLYGDLPAGLVDGDPSNEHLVLASRVMMDLQGALELKKALDEFLASTFEDEDDDE